jgi:hypothetical protein
MWWQSADQPLPEGHFDLAYTIGINAFRGERNVQLTWVDTRLFAPRVVEVVSKPTIQVRDYRDVGAPEPVLRSLTSSAPGDDDSVGGPIVWAEGVDAFPGISFYDRTALHEADALIVWTIPPGPGELREALERVAPEEVVLFGVDPGLDTPRAFLRRLAGLVKYALREHGGEVSLSTLAAHTAHSTTAVRLGLEWMARKGQVEIVSRAGGRVVLCPGNGRTHDRLDIVQAQLLAVLEETAAYRVYFGHADAQRLIGA